MIERQRLKLWCDECKEINARFKKEPPCEDCFPGIDRNNIEAWEVFQLVNYNSMGVTPADVSSVASDIVVDDIREIHYKVGVIVKELAELNDKERERAKDKPGEWQDTVFSK